MPEGTVIYKKCSRCEKDFPKNNEFFRKDKSCKSGFRSNCRECAGYPFGPIKIKHSLSNINIDIKRADCLICGPNIKISCPPSMDIPRCQKGRNAYENGFQDDYFYAKPPEDGKCEICDQKKRLVYDHDHSTGKFRGWLCDGCNVSLGRFNDDIALFKRAIEYLQKSQ